MGFQPKIRILDNGLKVLTAAMPQSRSVTALLMVKVGSRYETAEIAGISHFLEHMVFKGTKKYPTAFDLTSAVDSLGAEFNAFTSKEYTGFYVKSAANHLDLALDILSQLVFHALLPEKEMEKEKGVIIEEINMSEDNPMLKVGVDFELLIYGKSHLGRPTIGSKESVLKMRKKDFTAYLSQYYQPRKMVLGIVGGTPPVKNSLIGKYFSSRQATLDAREQNQLEKLKFIQQKPQLRVKYKKTEQTHFCLGVRAFPQTHPDRYVMAVLATILGGNMSSRLFTEVREKRGLAYYIKSDITTYFDNGYLVTQAGTDINKAEEAVKIILSEYQKVGEVDKSSGKVERELKRAKEYLKGRLALGLEDSKSIAGFFVEDLLLEDKIRTPATLIKGVEKVSLADLKRVGQKIFVNQGLNLAIIGPYKDSSKFSRILSV